MGEQAPQTPKAAFEKFDVAEGNLSRQHPPTHKPPPQAALEDLDAAEDRGSERATASAMPGTGGTSTGTVSHQQTSATGTTGVLDLTHGPEPEIGDYYTGLLNELHMVEEQEEDPFDFGFALD